MSHLIWMDLDKKGETEDPLFFVNNNLPRKIVEEAHLIVGFSGQEKHDLTIVKSRLGSGYIPMAYMVPDIAKVIQLREHARARGVTLPDLRRL